MSKTGLTLYQTTKFWTVTKLKGFADDKLNVAKMASSLFDRAENTLGKGENAGYQHFLLFPLCFPKLSTSGSLKVGIVWSRVNAIARSINWRHACAVHAG